MDVDGFTMKVSYADTRASSQSIHVTVNDPCDVVYQVKGEEKSVVKVKVGDKDCITDSKGEFSVTESNTGTYEVSVAPNGYLSQKTSVKIADNAENRSVVKVAFALTEVSPVTEVVLDEMTDPITVEDESTSNEAIPTTTEDFGQVEPDKVVEDMPLAKVEIVIPAGVIKEDAQEDPTLVKNGKVDISVTTFVPAPKEVVTEVKPTEVVEAVKSLPLAAAQFQPTGLQFSEPVNISIPNPIPGVTFPKATMQLSYLNPDNGEWEVQAAEVTVGEANYKAPVTHFSAYAIENQVNSKVEKEVIQKFSSSVDQNLLEDVIEHLKEIGYINDESYIERAVNEFMAINTLSIREMKNKLYAKGISSDIIDWYFEKNEDEIVEYELRCAKKTILKKQSQMEREEIEQFLYRKGYSLEITKEAFEEV